MKLFIRINTAFGSRTFVSQGMDEISAREIATALSSHEGIAAHVVPDDARKSLLDHMNLHKKEKQRALERAAREAAKAENVTAFPGKKKKIQAIK